MAVFEREKAVARGIEVEPDVSQRLDMRRISSFFPLENTDRKFSIRSPLSRGMPAFGGAIFRPTIQEPKGLKYAFLGRAPFLFWLLVRICGRNGVYNGSKTMKNRALDKRLGME